MSSPDVIDLLLARVRRGSRAPHGDAARIALAVEGGGMRGVVSAGMVSALEQLGMATAFDAVYGSSAGAINAAYFLAGQARLGTRIYYEDINTTRFIRLARALTGRPIVDLGFLLDEVAIRRKPLDTARVLAAPSPLAVLATDVESRMPAILRDFPDSQRLLDALRAGATMPIIAGAPRAYNGRHYLDASITDPIPVGPAERDGHTHILVLLTRGSAMRLRPSAFDRYFVGPRLRRLSPALAVQYLDRATPYARLMHTIDGGRGPAGSASVTSIRVNGLHISKLERRATALQHGSDRGFAAVIRAFER
jgi:predicted patatin/cPLA2 family phospholipase